MNHYYRLPDKPQSVRLWSEWIFSTVEENNQYTFLIKCPLDTPARLCDVYIIHPSESSIINVSYMGTDVHPATITDGHIPLEGFPSIWSSANDTKAIEVKVTIDKCVSNVCLKVHYLQAPMSYIINYRDVNVGRTMTSKCDGTFTYKLNTLHPKSTPRFLRGVSLANASSNHIIILKGGEVVSCPVDLSTTSDVLIQTTLTSTEHTPVLILKFGGATPQIIS